MRHDLDLALLDDVHEVAPVALAEHHIAVASSMRTGSRGVGVGARRQVHDAVGERDQPLVVGGDDDEPAVVGELAEELQHALDLDVVEVRGRLVGEDDRRVVRERTRDRDALLLPARHVAGPVRHAVAEVDALPAVRSARARGRARDTPAARNGTITFSSAFSDGTRLNAWNTTPTVERRYSRERRALAARRPRSPPTITEPDVGVRIAASTDSSVVLPHPLAPSSSTSSPRLDVEVEAVDRPHRDTRPTSTR